LQLSIHLIATVEALLLRLAAIEDPEKRDAGLPKSRFLGSNYFNFLEGLIERLGDSERV
jgi:hypothetical protein